ncbi:MAG TPA: hypothetical protein VGD05_12435, partial [Pyrinomonadaceae bacterium]
VYLRQPALPKLIADRVIVTGGSEASDQLILRWETPNRLPFPMPVEVKTGDSVKRYEMPNGTVTIPIQHNKEYQIDPNGWLLKAQ